MISRRREVHTERKVILVKGTVDESYALVLHTDDGEVNIGHELSNFRERDIKVYIIDETRETIGNDEVDYDDPESGEPDEGEEGNEEGEEDNGEGEEEGDD